MRESPIQTAVCNYATSLGWMVFRFTIRSHPDRMFIRNGKFFFIEFKATGKKATRLQAHTIKKIQAQGFQVYVVDDIDQGKGIVDALSI